MFAIARWYPTLEEMGISILLSPHIVWESFFESVKDGRHVICTYRAEHHTYWVEWKPNKGFKFSKF